MSKRKSEFTEYVLGIAGCVLLCQVCVVCVSVHRFTNVCTEQMPQTEYCVAPVCACQNILCDSALPTLEGAPGWPHLLPQHLVSARKGT